MMLSRTYLEIVSSTIPDSWSRSVVVVVVKGYEMYVFPLLELRVLSMNNMLKLLRITVK